MKAPHRIVRHLDPLVDPVVDDPELLRLRGPAHGVRELRPVNRRRRHVDKVAVRVVAAPPGLAAPIVRETVRVPIVAAKVVVVVVAAAAAGVPVKVPLVLRSLVPPLHHRRRARRRGSEEVLGASPSPLPRAPVPKLVEVTPARPERGAPRASVPRIPVAPAEPARRLPLRDGDGEQQQPADEDKARDDPLEHHEEEEAPEQVRERAQGCHGHGPGENPRERPRGDVGHARARREDGPRRRSHDPGERLRGIPPGSRTPVSGPAPLVVRAAGLERGPIVATEVLSRAVARLAPFAARAEFFFIVRRLLTGSRRRRVSFGLPAVVARRGRRGRPRPLEAIVPRVGGAEFRGRRRATGVPSRRALALALQIVVPAVRARGEADGGAVASSRSRDGRGEARDRHLASSGPPEGGRDTRRHG